MATCRNGFTLTSVLAVIATCGASPGEFSAPPTSSQAASARVLSNALTLRRHDPYIRAAVHVDPIEARMVAGSWDVPKEGDIVEWPEGKKAAWNAVRVNEKGAFAHEDLRNGYLRVEIEAESEGVSMLHAVGHTMLYLNGVPRVGDPYSAAYVRIPVWLNKGVNEALLLCQRGAAITVSLSAPPAAVFLDPGDATLPDVEAGRAFDAGVGIRVINASPHAVDDLSIVPRGTSDMADASLESVNAWGRTNGTHIPPLSVRKIALRLKGRAPEKPGAFTVELAIHRVVWSAGTRPQDARPESPLPVKITLNARDAKSPQRIETFLSGIDNSVQYYAHKYSAGSPMASQQATNGPLPGLILTLHGAGVEASGQAACYAARPFAHIIAPTNRRPFGFDWEDWGRLDAIEVLGIAQSSLSHDPSRVYLTGHSMGGHGTWSIGAIFPDRFAAIGPSAGWCDFSSYTGITRSSGDSPLREIMRRANATSDVAALVRNYARHGVYILHGDADDNVPVEQARRMEKLLSEFHHDWVKHEQPGAGHWWGDECVDWPPMMDFFAKRRRPDKGETRQVSFTTVNPGVSAQCEWVTIDAQHKSLAPSNVTLEWSPRANKLSGTTDNVSRMSIDLAALRPTGPMSIALDGQTLENQAVNPAGALHLRMDQERKSWEAAGEASLAHKGPHRAGPFKDAFRHGFMLVYGTGGNVEEQAWALAKSRFDAEVFWYRGNGGVEVIPDHMYRASTHKDRGIILYGNADTNAAYKQLLADSPVQIRGGEVRIAGRRLAGDDLACLLVRPRPDSNRACVAVIGGSGVRGMRLTDRLAWWQSGVGYPDCVVLEPRVLTTGWDGIRAAGYFGNDWGVESGEFAVRD